MVTLIGMGSGKWEALSAQAQQAVRSAGLVFGAKRLLAGLPPECTARQFALYQPADILETLAQNPGQDAAVLYSGDTGFYSGASGLLTPLRTLGIPARVYPGVSSIQLLSAALGRPWQNWKLVSAHGCACDPVAECMMNRSVFFLTGGTETPASLCQKLTDAGMGEAHGVVGENLGTEAEAIRYGSAAELAGQSFAPLSVLLVENFDLPQLRAPGFPDESFIRSEVPMTKQEVRAAALAKLAVMPTDTLWDVGAGTGSVSVELALAAPKGRVYAVECEPDACELIRKTGQSSMLATSSSSRAAHRMCWQTCLRRMPCSSAAPKAAWKPCWMKCSARIRTHASAFRPLRWKRWALPLPPSRPGA